MGIRWSNFLYNKPELVDPEFALSASAARNKRAFIKKVLHNAPNNPPINFQLLTAPDFMDWIVTVRKRMVKGPVLNPTAHIALVFLICFEVFGSLCPPNCKVS